MVLSFQRNEQNRTSEIRGEGDRQIVFVVFVISLPAQASCVSTVKIEVVREYLFTFNEFFMLPAIHAVKVMRDQKKHERCRVLTFPLQQRRGNRS